MLARSNRPRAEADYVPDVAMAWIAAGDERRGLALFNATPPLDAMHRRLLAQDPRLDGIRRDPRFRTWTQSEAPQRG
jgi:hypothetical protein